MSRARVVCRWSSRMAVGLAMGFSVAIAGSCGLPMADWILLPIENRKGEDIELARVRVDLFELRQHLGSDPTAYAFYSEGREPLPFVLLPKREPRYAELRLPLPAAGLRLTVVDPGPAATASIAEGPASRWPARVEYDRIHR